VDATASVVSRGARPRTRVRLCGPLELGLDGRGVAGDLRGRQARLITAYLITHRERAIGRSELIAMLWPDEAPKDPKADLRSILSGLRRTFGAEVLSGGDQLRLALPDPVWVDTEAAAAAITAARVAARAGDWQAVGDQARSALDLLAPGFLAGEDAHWIEARRRELEETELEALEWAARSALALGGTELGAVEQAARELISRSPYRETGYRYLMEALAAEGNAAEALRVYEELRVLLRDELGTAPAAELQALHKRLLGGQPPPSVPEQAPPPAPEPAPAHAEADRVAVEGERKQVTVLFADLVGSMEVQQHVDPEEWRAVIDRLFQILCAGVHRFEGTVDKFTGDGIMAIFGAPIAREDHARRACHAALHLQRELAVYAAELRRTQGLSLSVRIGLNSGEVVVGAIGEDLAMAYTAVGYTVGLAERMEQLAAPDRIYLSEDTASLVAGYFTLADLGEFKIRGATGPLGVYELTGVGGARGALDVARARGLSRFVGRDDELRTLETALEAAFSGHGQVIGIVGEPGVGKSRLCHELAERCRAKGITVYHAAAQPHAKSIPLVPLLQLLRDYFGVTESDSEQTARERIAGKLLLLDPSFEEELPLLFEFLAVPDPERPPERMDPEARQRRLLTLLKRLTHAQSAREPVLTLLEDLHWLDPATEVFLANHVEAVGGARGLTLANFRPEYHAPWMSRSYYRQIGLAPLGPEAVERLLAELLGSNPSLDGLRELISERTRGNPFFIEELVRSLVEAGSLVGERGAYRLAQPIERMAVPATVQAVLAARIDRLVPRDKAVLQAAAVIGKEFSQPILDRVAELEAEELEDALRNLVAGEFVDEQEPYPEPIYAFRHPLTQQVAYGSQLTQRRARTHAAAARAVAEHYSERLDERAALIARHWEAAGERLEAARWHARAATWSAYNDPTDALRHWRKVRALTDALPDSTESAALGLAARTNVLNYGWRLGISPYEAEATFAEAERMAGETGDVRSRVFLLAAYGAVKAFAQGEPREHAELLRRAAALAEESGDPDLYMAIAPFAIAFLYTGAYREGIAILDRAIELADGDPGVGAGVVSACPYAYCHAVKGGFLAYLGELPEARRLIDQGRRLAGEHGDLESVGWSHVWSVSLGFVSGESEASVRHARRALEIADRIGDTYSRALAWNMLAWAESTRGAWREAIEALEHAREISGERLRPVEADSAMLGVLGESCLGLGELERARGMAEEGLENARARGLRFLEPLGGVLLARVLLGCDGTAAREKIQATLARALDVARETGAKSFEPHVHLELAELARQLGDEETRQRKLREAHRLFTEIGATGHAERLAAELATAAG
jgi:adenylate cyclase